MLQMAGRMGVLGTETAFEVLARANALAAAGRSIINLGIGQPDFPTPGHIVEASTRRSPTVVAGTRRLTASRRCVRRSRPISCAATGSRFGRTRC